MTTDFRLPDLGEGLVDAELVAWQVAVGDTVTLNQTIAEVETAKAVVELPSPYDGTVTALHAEPGDVIEVGGPLISFALTSAAGDDVTATSEARVETTETDGADAPQHARADPPETAAESPPATLVGYGAVAASGRRPTRRPRRAAATAPRDAAVLAAAPHDVVDDTTTTTPAAGERPRSTPPVRKHARELGVDLTRVTPTGPQHLITRADVDRHAASSRGSAPVPAAENAAQDAPPLIDEARVVRTPIRGVRRRTAEAMVRSAFTAPHASTSLTVDVTPTMELIARLRAERGEDRARIGILAVTAKAVCLALRRHPALNSSWDEDAGEIAEFRFVNLGIAAATERGLVVPSIKEAHTFDLAELAAHIGDLAAAARDGRLSPADLAGSTFTLTNVGVFGVDTGTPILNPGEAGILALGAVRRQPWEHQGGIELREVLTLSLSFDHRLVDGEQGARFLAEVGRLLADPGRAMLLS